MSTLELRIGGAWLPWYLRLSHCDRASTTTRPGPDRSRGTYSHSVPFPTFGVRSVAATLETSRSPTEALEKRRSDTRSRAALRKNFPDFGSAGYPFRHG